jgi:monovalent cation:H+ antiporter-2, CPA2 family
MAADVLLIVDMVTVLGTAAGAGYLASRLGQPVLMGYLLAGLVVGPSGLKLIPSPEEIEVLRYCCLPWGLSFPWGICSKCVGLR